MDDDQFDTVVRLLGSRAHRRRLLAGLIAILPVALGIDESEAKKRRKKKRKKKCPHAQNCAGKQCGDDGCGGTCGTCGSTCGTCGSTDVCNASGQCACEPDCSDRPPCADDGCGGTCGSCQNGSCSNGQCLCPFGIGCDTPPPGNPGFCAPCSTGLCCPEEQTCLDGSCAACPETPDPCNVVHICGQTTAQFPFCYCVTSVDDTTTCSSVFVNPSQPANCDADEDCVGLLGFGVEMVCVDVPCLGLGIQKVCMNQGCEDLSASRATARSERTTSPIRQLDLHPRH